MKVIFGGKSIVCLALAWSLIASVCPAQSATNPTPNLDKHARKIHKRLARYPNGTYLNVEFRDGSEGSGALSAMALASFTLTDLDSNAQVPHLYADVARLSKGKEYIGEGSEPGHHIRLWVPVVVGVVAAGAALTAIEVR
ncbi:MAG: hypothetical protein WBE72_19150 [Terracidiphilus sp.]